MERLTTNEPQGNTETMLNMVFVKNEEVYLRGIGDDSTDISLVDYCKSEYKRLYGEDIDADATEFGEYMDDDSLLSLFYWACVGFAEVRQRLMKYEDEAEKIVIKPYKCVKGVALEKCDDDGFTLDGEHEVIEEDSIWHIPEDKDYRLIGGEIRLEDKEGRWIEICKETLKEHFQEM